MAEKRSQTRTPPLRKQAEARWKKEHSRAAQGPHGARAGDATESLQSAIHELQVHQIELEMQNEELQRAQLELADARDSYLELYDFAPLGYLTLDEHRVIRRANLTAATLLGVQRGRLPGMRMERFVAKEEQDVLYMHLRDARDAREAGPVPRTCIIRMHRHNGGAFVARLDTLADFPAGASGGCRVAIADITALHEAEESLKQSERRFRALTEQGSDYISIVDAAGTITYENPSVYRALGFAAGELVGHSGFELIHPEDLPEARRMFDRLVRRPGGFAETELRAAARDGSWRWLRVLATNLLHDPAVQGIVVNSRDVTERREAAEELRRANEALDRRVAARTAELELLFDVASMANRSQDVMQAIDYCLRRLAEHAGWLFGHALTPDVDPLRGRPDEMRVARAWYPDGAHRYAEFRRATESTRFVRGEGMVGQVRSGRAPVWTDRVPDILTGARRRAAKKLGLRAAMAFPVLVGDHVAAVLEFFSAREMPPEKGAIDLLSGVGVQLSRVMERAILQEHLLTIADQTQQRIAQDLHDDVGQEMTGLALKAETLAEAMGAGDPRCGPSGGAGAAAPCAFPGDVRHRCGALAADLLAAANRTQTKIRSLARRILPVELELNSLPGALDQLCREAARGAEVDCEFRNSHSAETFDARIAAQLYRIAQEAIANAIRHARPRKIRIELAETGGQTVLRVSDDGRGIPAPQRLAGGLGLRTMNYRADLIGAALEISPGPGGRGTVVTCRLPAAGAPTLHPVRRRRPEACPRKS